jgi:hypothetical protein
MQVRCTRDSGPAEPFELLRPRLGAALASFDLLVGAGDQCERHTEAEQLTSSGAANINGDSVDHSAAMTRGFPFSMMKALYVLAGLSVIFFVSCTTQAGT